LPTHPFPLKYSWFRPIRILMSSINPVSNPVNSPVKPGVADLLRTFSRSESSSVSAALSSKAVQSALAVASPHDLVRLSVQAIQLQQVTALFDSSGDSNASLATTDRGAALLQALANPTSASAAASTSRPPAGETLAQQEAAALFGTNSVTGAGNNAIRLLG
jgi:hypothetical protein